MYFTSASFLSLSTSSSSIRRLHSSSVGMSKDGRELLVQRLVVAVRPVDPWCLKEGARLLQSRSDVWMPWKLKLTVSYFGYSFPSVGVRGVGMWFSKEVEPVVNAGNCRLFLILRTSRPFCGDNC